MTHLSAIGHTKFVRVTRLGRGKSREEPLDVLGWVGEHLMTLTPPAANQMDCMVIDPGGKLWPIDESDQALARKAMRNG